MVRHDGPVIRALRPNRHPAPNDAAERCHHADGNVVRRALHALAHILDPGAHLLGKHVVVERRNGEEAVWKGDRVGPRVNPVMGGLSWCHSGACFTSFQSCSAVPPAAIQSDTSPPAGRSGSSRMRTLVATPTNVCRDDVGVLPTDSVVVWNDDNASGALDVRGMFSLPLHGAAGVAGCGDAEFQQVLDVLLALNGRKTGPSSRRPRGARVVGKVRCARHRATTPSRCAPWPVDRSGRGRRR